ATSGAGGRAVNGRAIPLTILSILVIGLALWILVRSVAPEVPPPASPVPIIVLPTTSPEPTRSPTVVPTAPPETLLRSTALPSSTATQEPTVAPTSTPDM